MQTLAAAFGNSLSARFYLILACQFPAVRTELDPAELSNEGASGK
jgi:hypothetical protein